jgi:hypothetical protein
VCDKPVSHDGFIESSSEEKVRIDVFVDWALPLTVFSSQGPNTLRVGWWRRGRRALHSSDDLSAW